jgi:hypothetical protein
MARLRAITGSQWRRIVRIVRKGAFSRRRRDGAGCVRRRFSQDRAGVKRPSARALSQFFAASAARVRGLPAVGRPQPVVNTQAPALTVCEQPVGPPSTACAVIRTLANSGADAGPFRALTIRNRGESHSDCSMLEVSPLADVPRANMLRVCKPLQLGRKPTHTENSTHHGERNHASV